jgi:ubiquinone/menaquinone biosynthesis C-methylase UbiE
MTSELARDYFEFLADLGHTKHYGSLEATRMLIDRCQIDAGSYVLDVGCGVGATPVYLAKNIGCRVMGVDLVEKMVAQSRAWAQAEGLTDHLEFRVADALDLPFEDNTFDAVIMESVNIFLDDKASAMPEYIRVARPGGFVGMTEMTWLKSPSSEMEKAFQDMVFATAMEANGWLNLLKEAGLVEVAGGGYRMDVRKESRGRIERYGRWRVAKVVPKMIGMLFGDRRARKFISGGTGAISRNMLDVIGYGVYVGRKG